MDVKRNVSHPPAMSTRTHINQPQATDYIVVLDIRYSELPKQMSLGLGNCCAEIVFGWHELAHAHTNMKRYTLTHWQTQTLTHTQIQIHRQTHREYSAKVL